MEEELKSIKQKFCVVAYLSGGKFYIPVPESCTIDEALAATIDEEEIAENRIKYMRLETIEYFLTEFCSDGSIAQETIEKSPNVFFGKFSSREVANKLGYNLSPYALGIVEIERGRESEVNRVCEGDRVLSLEEFRKIKESLQPSTLSDQPGN